MEVLNRSTVTLAGAVGPHAAPANPTIDCFRGSTDDFMVIVCPAANGRPERARAAGGRLVRDRQPAAHHS